ncbi:MAG: TetR/AcrR family transcriptional regulator [Myxococcales bacterium]|nr:TetR/AcrR family transcriptional regulator [Myxococcales bacterium]
MKGIQTRENKVYGVKEMSYHVPVPRAPLSEDQVQAQRDRIVEAATDLFVRDGYEALTMRRIAQVLGESPMTAYRYFEGKAEIFAAVRTHLYRRFADSQRVAFESCDGPMARLLAMREAYLAFAFAEPTGYRVMFELGQAPQDDFPEQSAEGERAFGYLLRAVEAAMDARLMHGDPLTTAHLLWAQVHGIVTLHLAGKLHLGRTLEDLRHLDGWQW